MADDTDLDDVKDESESSTDEADSEESAEAASQPSEEEAKILSEWRNLKGNTQERIRQLIEERNQALAKAQPEETPPAPNVVQQQQLTEEAKRAIDFLKSSGAIFKEDFDQYMNDLRNQMFLETQHAKLESRFDGSEGRPKYDRVVVQDHMKAKGLWDPQVAYDDLYREELTDWHIKKALEGKAPFQEAGGQSTAKKAATGLSREEVAKMTPEEYEANREKIMKAMLAGEL